MKYATKHLVKRDPKRGTEILYQALTLQEGSMLSVTPLEEPARFYPSSLPLEELERFLRFFLKSDSAEELLPELLEEYQDTYWDSLSPPPQTE